MAVGGTPMVAVWAAIAGAWAAAGSFFFPPSP